MALISFRSFISSFVFAFSDYFWLVTCWSALDLYFLKKYLAQQGKQLGNEWQQHRDKSGEDWWSRKTLTHDDGESFAVGVPW